MNLSMRLFQRQNGVWYAEFDRRTRLSLKTRDGHAARRLFERLKKAYLSRHLALLEGRPPARRLGNFLEEYLEHRFRTKAPLTHQTDAQALKRLLAFCGPDLALSSLTPRLLDAWVAGLARQVKPVSANTWLRHVKAALSQAVAWGYLKDNPARRVRPLPVQRAYPRFLNREDVRRLLTAEPDPAFRRLWRFLLLTGCRRSEALALQAQDIDWPGGRLSLPLTKNRRPQAIILTDELAALLQELPQVGRLFPWRPDTVTHHFQRTARAAGLSCRLHDLRHTFGSWLAQAGISLQVIRDLMGHQDIKTTQLYAYLSQEHLTPAANYIQACLPPPGA